MPDTSRILHRRSAALDSVNRLQKAAERRMSAPDPHPAPKALNFSIAAAVSNPQNKILTGELDIASTTMLEQQALDFTDHDLVLDLSGLTFIDAAGLGTLVHIANTLRASELGLTLRSPNPQIRSTFALTGLESMLQPYSPIERPPRADI